MSGNKFSSEQSYLNRGIPRWAYLITPLTFAGSRQFVMDYIRYSFHRKVSYCVVTICVYIKLNSVWSLDFYSFPFVFIHFITFLPGRPTVHYFVTFFKMSGNRILLSWNMPRITIHVQRIVWLKIRN